MSKAVLQHAPRESASPRTPSFTASRGGLLQRKCACGGTPGATGECEACRKKRLTGSNASQLVARPAPLADKQVREVELGHTDCDWDRAVKPDEPFKPRSGDAKVKIGDEKCTLPCTAEHEAVHLQQVGPLCKSYFTCYTGAPAKAKEAKDCKEITKPDERKKCEDLYTEFFRLECFVAVAGAWDAEAWECAAYKKSLACAEKELARGEKDCQGKLKEYKESAQKQIAKYCKAEKEKKEEGKKPEGSKEPAEPKKPAEPEKPKEPEKKPKEPKEALLHAGTLQRLSAAGARDEPNEVPPIVNEVLRSPGQPLDAETRAFMEPRFGHNFGDVRVHADPKAAESARRVQALAYTMGRNIVFGEGQYASRTRSGQMLMAHELAHVMQQSGADKPQVIRQVSQPSDAAEIEADQIARAFTNRALSSAITTSRRGIMPGLDKGSYESPRTVRSPGMIYRQLLPLPPSTARAWRMLRAGSVINNSNKPVTVWRDHFGPPYTIAAGAKSKPDEDVDHIKDEQGQWYKIGWNTVTVDATGKVDGYKCKVPTYNMDCPTPEKSDRPLTPAVSTGVASQTQPKNLLKR